MICKSNKDINKRIVFDCDCRNYQSKIEISTHFQRYFRKVINELTKKYEILSNNLYDIIQLSENKKTCFEFNHPLNLNENFLFGSKEEIQWIELTSESSNFDIFEQP